MFFDSKFGGKLSHNSLRKKHLDIFSTNLLEKTHDNQHVFFHLTKLKINILTRFFFTPIFKKLIMESCKGNFNIDIFGNMWDKYGS
jgi:hypothetical protein